MKLAGCGMSDKGQVRPHNEDALLVDAKRGLFAVADGMGGHAAGEVASKLAIEAVQSVFQEFQNGGGAESDVAALLTRSVEEANRRIAETIEQHPEFQGMGTTLVACVFLGHSMWTAHVGDSRAYLLRGSSLTQLTVDHSFVNELVRLGMLSKEEAARDPRRNVVTRALGSGLTVTPDVEEHRVNEGDMVMLCTDGLNSMLTDQKIREVFHSHREDLESACANLIEHANRAGGEDNVTVVLAAASEVEDGSIVSRDATLEIPAEDLTDTQS